MEKSWRSPDASNRCVGTSRQEQLATCGGPDVLSYGEMLDRMAVALGKRPD
jgi:hypothetical protein